MTLAAGSSINDLAVTDPPPSGTTAAPAPAVAASVSPHRRATLRLPRLVSALRAQQTNLGTGFLGIAATTLAALLLVFEIGRFALLWHGYAAPGLAAAAWLLVAGLLAALAATARKAGDHLRSSVAAAVTAGLGIVVALDVVAVWPGGDLGHDLTAAPATGLVLLAMAGVRSARSIVLTAGGLFVVLATCVLLSWIGHDVTAEVAEPAVAMLLRAVAPSVVAASIVAAFRRIVGAELERVLVQSTVSAPRFAVGMLASEELARLDLAAEQLLDDVATGRSRLPLNPATAQAAASIATELRLHLIEGRRQTWLYHAVSESDVLGRTVTLTDSDSLAGLLDQRQRDGLLQAVWLLLGDSPERSRRSASRVTVQVTVGPSRPVDHPTGVRSLHVPISIRTTGVPRNRVDPTTWDAIRKVGRHVDVQRDGSVSVDIDCLVERPQH
jgi:hypothetical protein